jgi:predicted nucleic acid-binding protein
MATRFYFDTNAFLKYYCPLWRREEEGVLQIRRLVSNSPHPILISPLTSLEFVNKVIYFYHCNTLKNRNILKTIIHARQHIGANGETKPFVMIDMPGESKDVFRLAEQILLDHSDFAMGPNDALHLAIVQKLPAKPILVTSDKAMKKVCERMQISFFDPLIDNE